MWIAYRNPSTIQKTFEVEYSDGRQGHKELVSEAHKSLQGLFTSDIARNKINDLPE